MSWGIPYCILHPPQVKQININTMLKQQAQIQLRNHPNERQVNQHQRNILMFLSAQETQFILVSAIKHCLLRLDKFNTFT